MLGCAQDPATTFPWLDLPGDLQQRVLRHLRPGITRATRTDGRKNLRLVCHALKEFVDSGITRLSAPSILDGNLECLAEERWGSTWMKALLPTTSRFPSVTTLDLSTGDVRMALLTCARCLRSGDCFPALHTLITGGFEAARWTKDLRFAEGRPPFAPALQDLHIPNVTTWEMRMGGECNGLPNIGRLRDFSGLRSLCLTSTSRSGVQDNDLESLRFLTQLTSLTLDGCTLCTRRGLDRISWCPWHYTGIGEPALINLRKLSLQELDLEQSLWRGTVIEPLVQLAGLTRLGSLDLGRCKGVCNDAIRFLPALKHCLTALSLESTSVAESSASSACQRLAELSGLQVLNLNRTHVGPGLHQLSVLTNLMRLHLGGFGVLSSTWDPDGTAGCSDTALQRLSTLNALSRLHLSGCLHITNVGVQAIARLSALQALDLTRLRVPNPNWSVLLSLRDLQILALENLGEGADQGLGTLMTLPRLKCVGVKWTHLSQETKRTLEQCQHVSLCRNCLAVKPLKGLVACSPISCILLGAKKEHESTGCIGDSAISNLQNSRCFMV